MSLTNSLRYELITEPSKRLESYWQKERERVIKDEKASAFEKERKKFFTDCKMSEWYDSLDELATRKRNKINHKAFKNEIRNANKAFIATRKAALENVLKADREKYQQELAKMGKAFYVQRM